MRQSRTKLDRQKKIASFRLAGITDQRAIAAKLGVNQSTISRDFAELDARFRAESLQDIQTAVGIDLERVEKMIRAIWPKALRGSFQAIDRVDRLLSRRARLLGLDRPIQIDFKKMVLDEVAALGLDEHEAAALETDVERWVNISRSDA